MNETIGLAAVSVLAAYLIGSIPFGYLIARWAKGIDIRTVGSGNLGATNVGRTLGFRYFLLVLALDLLKGFVPTLGFPWILGRLDGPPPADLPVLIALAAILGHTFPVYLKFRGGKGVATSLGVVLALDPVSCGVAVLVFGGVMLVTRYVSLSALAACLAFAAAHFARGSAPLSREHLAMTLFTIGVVALLILRHRSNLARIWAGTENRVNFRGPRARPDSQAHPGGRISLILLSVLLLLLMVGGSGGLWLYHNANQPIEVGAGPWMLRETDRVYSGQQRVDRIAFAAGGTRLAATCPRYERVAIYQVEPPDHLKEIKVIDLEGRPVAVTSNGDRFLVLVRPSGDRRHLEPGWWETFDIRGNRVGRRIQTGYYPDDFAVSPDRQYLVVIDSGRAEGDARKPAPSLEVIATNFQTNTHRVVGRLAFDQGDDPERLTISASGQCAAVLLANSNRVAAIDLSTPASPKHVGRTEPTDADTPYVSYSTENEWIMMPVAGASEAVAIDLLQPNMGVAADGTTTVPHADYLVCTRQKDSVLELFQSSPRHSLGRLPLRGPLNLGRTRPTGLAYSPALGLLAVATRSGTIHLIELVPRSESRDGQPRQIAATHSEQHP